MIEVLRELNEECMHGRGLVEGGSNVPARVSSESLSRALVQEPVDFQ